MRVFLVDDSTLVRSRLVELLAELKDVEVVGQAASVAEARTGLLRLVPDVAVLDLRLPDGNGLDLLRWLKARFPVMAVGIVTNFPDEPFRVASRTAGADFFLDKSAEFDHIPDELRRLAARSAASP